MILMFLISLLPRSLSFYCDSVTKVTIVGSLNYHIFIQSINTIIFRLSFSIVLLGVWVFWVFKYYRNMRSNRLKANDLNFLLDLYLSPFHHISKGFYFAWFIYILYNSIESYFDDALSKSEDSIVYLMILF